MSNGPLENLINLSKTLNKYLSAIDFRLSELGYTQSECQTLMLIQQYPNLMESQLSENSPHDIIETRRIIRKLGRSGFIDLTPDNGYCISQKGSELMNEIDEIQSNIISYINAKVPQKKKTILNQAVNNILSTISPT